MSVQAVWSLGETVAASYEVARGVLEAATSDNVQPLALLACEKFGNTLAMCPETCDKIERCVLPTPQPAVITFLQATVGYSPKDTATQLGRSAAGVRFLGLAAALAETMTPYEGSKALEIMIGDTASDKTLLPTRTHLQNVLGALQPRCLNTKFADQVVFWMHLILSGVEEARREEIRDLRVPTPSTIANLIEGFRQLARVGESSVMSLSISASRSLPWIAALVQWCLGVDPSLYLRDGFPLLQTRSRGPQVNLILHAPVTRLLQDKSEAYVTITIHHSMGSPVDLVVPPGNVGHGEMMIGFVSISEFGRCLLAKYHLDRGMANRAFLEAARRFLATAVPTRRTFEARTDNDDARLDPHIPNLFPPIRTILAVFSMVSNINMEETKQLAPLEGDERVTDLGITKIHLDDLKSRCKRGCCNDFGERNHTYGPCWKKEFLDAVASVICIVLSISLFAQPDFVRFLLQPPSMTSLNSNFTQMVRLMAKHMTETKIQEPFHVGDFLDLALTLVGHRSASKDRRSLSQWIMSSMKGQVVFPELFETQQIHRVGYLRLVALPGEMRYQSEVYLLVENRPVILAHPSETASDPEVLSEEQLVTGPRNLFPDVRVVWMVSAADRMLYASMTVTDSSGKYVVSSVNGVDALKALSAALVVENCPHGREEPLKPFDRNCRYTQYLRHSEGKSRHVPSMVDIVGTEDAADLRLIALASSKHCTSYTSALEAPAKPKQCGVVLRGDACLRCCLEVCRRMDGSTVIL